jgi:cell division protein FtsI/penicillin-binding protein 2
MSSIGWKPPEERDPEIQQIPGIGGRLLFMRVVVIIVLSLLVYRVYFLQATKGPGLAERATENRRADNRRPPRCHLRSPGIAAGY